MSTNVSSGIEEFHPKSRGGRDAREIENALDGWLLRKLSNTFKHPSLSPKNQVMFRHINNALYEPFGAQVVSLCRKFDGSTSADICVADQRISLKKGNGTDKNIGETSIVEQFGIDPGYEANSAQAERRLAASSVRISEAFIAMAADVNKFIDVVNRNSYLLERDILILQYDGKGAVLRKRPEPLKGSVEVRPRFKGNRVTSLVITSGMTQVRFSINCTNGKDESALCMRVFCRQLNS